MQTKIKNHIDIRVDISTYYISIDKKYSPCVQHERIRKPSLVVVDVLRDSRELQKKNQLLNMHPWGEFY